MSQFYARYVPPPSKARPTPKESAPVEKRKRASKDDPVPAKPKKLRTADEKKDTDDVAPRSETVSEPVTQKKPKAKKTRLVEDGLHPVRSKEESPEKVDQQRDRRKEKKAKEKEVRPKPSPEKSDSESIDEEYNRKHDSVLSKFNKARQKRPIQQEPQPTDEGATPELHGLEPIPQPEVVELPKGRPSYSTLAPWQADAVRVVHRQSKAFEELSISKSVIDNLKKNGIDKSFPIQTTVLPLLLGGTERHAGDVCVSAATGSGKTLAYVVPIVEDLKEHANTRLRAVIVVPTRELVQQVRQLCDICAAGTKLKVATASGSKAMNEEQNALLFEEDIYDPERWEKEQNASMDWASFSMISFLDEVERQRSSRSIRFVRQFVSKVDILITTPGRLVDHLRSTPGFNLDHVKWLVVDEADRLLNESYQEWIDTVTPALQSRTATATRDELLQSMRMKPPPRKVQKVLLSATMTSDISKLSSLDLVNPKLVVLGHPQTESKNPDQDGELEVNTEGDFNLPSALTEYVIQIKDGYEKPLYLLELLRQRILSQQNGLKPMKALDSSKAKHPDTDTDSSSASSSSSTSGSDSDSEPESSDTESDEDNDTESDSDSGSTSSSSSDGSTSSSSSSSSITPTTSPTQPSSPNRALIFTRSTAAAQRLSRLLSLLSPTLAPQISTLTKSTSTSSASRRALSLFRANKTSILIATDRASRGLDISDLQHVISYDIPSSALTYVHRVGRTARAGRAGTAWTLVEHREGRWFWGEIGGKAEGRIRRGEGRVVKKVGDLSVDVDGWKEGYEKALGRLGEEVRGS